MKLSDLGSELAGRFGAENVRYISDVHLRVASSDGEHEVWITPRGLRWREAGQQRIRSGPPARLLLRWQRYDRVVPAGGVRVGSTICITADEGNGLYHHVGKPAEVLAAVGPFLVLRVQGVDGPRAMLAEYAVPVAADAVAAAGQQEPHGGGDDEAGRAVEGRR